MAAVRLLLVFFRLLHWIDAQRAFKKSPLEGANYFPVSPSTAYYAGVGPSSIARSCKAGTVYTITDVEDLRNRVTELECIFAAGSPPNAIPLGPYYGKVLRFSSTDAFSPLIQILWKGKLGFTSYCGPKKVDFVLNMIGGQLRILGLLSIGRHTERLGPGEYDDGRESLIIDYTRNFEEDCETDPEQQYQQDDIHFNLLGGVYPFNQFVDIIRVVGRQKDGGVIYLGKTYFRDFFKADKQAYNIAMWALVNYCPSVQGVFAYGTPLPPLRQNFSYDEEETKTNILNIFPRTILLPPQLADSATRLSDDPQKVAVQRYFEMISALWSRMANSIGTDIRHGATALRHSKMNKLKSFIGILAMMFAFKNSSTNGVSSDIFSGSVSLDDVFWKNLCTQNYKANNSPVLALTTSFLKESLPLISDHVSNFTQIVAVFKKKLNLGKNSSTLDVWRSRLRSWKQS